MNFLLQSPLHAQIAQRDLSSDIDYKIIGIAGKAIELPIHQTNFSAAGKMKHAHADVHIICLDQSSPRY
jgi:hypothetical protein